MLNDKAGGDTKVCIAIAVLVLSMAQKHRHYWKQEQQTEAAEIKFLRHVTGYTRIYQSQVWKLERN